MTPIQSISIPEACHQSWQQMTPVERGRHCQQCCKTVTDFTVMSNQEIITYLAAAHDVCGRFDQAQLNSVNHQLDIQNLSSPNGWKKWVMAISLVSSTLFFKAQAQTKPIKTEQTDTTRGRQIPYDDVKIGKVASSVDPDKQIAFQDKIQCSRADSVTVGVLGGVVSVRRLSFVERVWYKIKHIF
jgi:hypothetical protein